MLYWIEIVLAFSFYWFGDYLAGKATPYLRDQKRVWSTSPLFNPANYLPEGQPARRRAARYWMYGGPIFLLHWVLLAIWTHRS